MKRFAAWILLCVLLLAGCAEPFPPPGEPSAGLPAPSLPGDAPSAPETEPPSRPEGPAGENYIRDMADGILRELKVDALPDDEKILAVYRYLMETVYFTDPVGQDIWRYRSGQTEPPTFLETMSISPLVFGVGSCEDFACALALLLEQMGFEALYVPGFTISAEGEYVDHAWTMVRLEKSWYHLDSQLEQNILKNGMTSYRYFLKTDAEMITDHKWGENLIAHFAGRMTAEEAARIRADYTPPACSEPYPQRQPEPVEKPPRPDRNALREALDRERQAFGPLPEIPLNNIPPVLVAPEPVFVEPYGRSFLNEHQQYLYDELVARAGEYDLTVVPLLGRLPESELERLTRYLHYDQPQLYWLTVEREENGLRLGVIPTLTLELARYRQAEIDAAVRRLLRRTSGSAARRSEGLHDALALSIRYDVATGGSDAANLYGGLVGGRGICDAFTRAYQYLLTRAGIENCFIVGSSARGVAHSWNALRLEGDWYYTDLTWDVPKGDDRLPYHDYLAVTGAEIRREHEFLADQYPKLPPAAETAFNYYVSGGYAVDPRQGRLTALLAEAFVNRLEADGIEEGGVQYLDAKLLCSPRSYEVYKRQYVEGLFQVLRETERLAGERGLPLRFETDGETGVSFNDAMQILVFHPRIYPAEEPVYTVI